MFSQDVLNHIYSFRPTHPIAQLIKNDIEIFIYFNKKRYIKKLKPKERSIAYNINDCNFNLMTKEEGFTSEQTIKLYYESRQEKKRLKLKIEDLGLALWETRTITHFPTKNKHGNFTELFYNGVEIIF